MPLPLNTRLLAVAVVAAVVVATPPASPPGDVTWLSPTPFDNASYTDGMPAGNGRVVVLAWGDPTGGGISFYVRPRWPMPRSIPRRSP